VEGIAGERSVYKKRAEAEVRNQPGENTRRQKRRLCFVMDCSGSMYRFNSLDGRLNRMLEATCLILESMEGHTNHFDYAILGHSGESAHIPFVSFGQPPANRGERLKILQKMLAHSQFCFPGDHTIEATDAAIDYVLQDFSVEPEHEKQAFVVVISDANFRTPQALEALHYFNSKNAGTGKPTQLMLHDRHCPGVTLARGRGWFVTWGVCQKGRAFLLSLQRHDLNTPKFFTQDMMADPVTLLSGWAECHRDSGKVGEYWTG